MILILCIPGTHHYYVDTIRIRMPDNLVERDSLRHNRLGDIDPFVLDLLVQIQKRVFKDVFAELINDAGRKTRVLAYHVNRVNTRAELSACHESGAQDTAGGIAKIRRQQDLLK